MERSIPIILVTNTAVKCAGVPQWIHGAHTKRVKPVEGGGEVVQAITNSQVPNSLRTEQVYCMVPKGGRRKTTREGR